MQLCIYHDRIHSVNEIAIVDNARKDRYDVQVIKHLHIFSWGLVS